MATPAEHKASTTWQDRTGATGPAVPLPFLVQCFQKACQVCAGAALRSRPWWSAARAREL